MAEAAERQPRRDGFSDENASRQIATVKTKEDAENAFLRIARFGRRCSRVSVRAVVREQPATEDVSGASKKGSASSFARFRSTS